MIGPDGQKRLSLRSSVRSPEVLSRWPRSIGSPVVGRVRRCRATEAPLEFSTGIISDTAEWISERPKLGKNAMMKPVRVGTATALAGLAALHTAWGLGSSFPFRDRATLADTVAGTRTAPQPRECFAVAGLLLTAAALVSDVAAVPVTARRVGALGVATVLGGRGLLGIAGLTGTVVPWTPSDRFTRLDRRFYGPLCLALAAGAAVAASE